MQLSQAYLRGFVHDVDVNVSGALALVVPNHNLDQGSRLENLQSASNDLERAGLATLGVDHVDADLAVVHRHIDVLALLQLLPVVPKDLHCKLRLLLPLSHFDGVSLIPEERRMEPGR